MEKPYLCNEKPNKAGMITQQIFNTQILPFTLKREGGYANVTGDKGGETYRGISRKNWASWQGWATIDKVKPTHNQIVPELEILVSNFYYTNFFVNKGFQYLTNTGTALALFDFAVHGGFSAQQFFTEFNKKFSKYIPVNSVVNAESLKLVNAANQKEVQKLIVTIREKHLARLLEINPSQLKFKAGWANRMAELKKTLGLNSTSYVLLVVAAAVLVGAFLYLKYSVI